MILSFILACGQFEDLGASAKIETLLEDPSQHASLEQCEMNSATILTGSEMTIDQSAGGRLSGDPQNWAADGDFPIIIGMDHSGSMYPGYIKGELRNNRPYYWTLPEFQDLLNKSVFSYSGPQKYEMYLFNDVATMVGKNLTREKAKRVFTNGPGGKLKSTPMAFHSANEYQKTKPLEFIRKAEKTLQASKAKGGVVWLITDNIADIGTSSEASETRRFYEYLEQTPQWQVIQAYPITKGDWLGGSTLMLYGLHYSESSLHNKVSYESWTKTAGAPLEENRLRTAFAPFSSNSTECGLPPESLGSAVRLKPNYLDIVTIEFVGEIECQTASIDAKSRKCSLDVAMTNKLPHRTVTNATISLESNGLLPHNTRTKSVFYQATPLEKGALSYTFTIPNSDISSLKPSQKEVIHIEEGIVPPRIENHTLMDLWQSANTPRFTLNGSVEVNIEGLKTQTTINSSCMKGVYGVETLPTIFNDFKSDEMSDTRCMDMTTRNPNTTFAIVTLCIIAGVTVLTLIIIGFFRPKYYRVYLDGEMVDNPIRFIPMITKYPIVHKNSELAKVKLSGSGTIVVTGVSCSIERSLSESNTWELTENTEYGSTFRVQVKKGMLDNSFSAMASDDTGF